MNPVFATSPEHAIALLADAFHRRDLDTIARLYDDNACFIPSPDVLARGSEAIRDLYTSMVQLDATFTLETNRVLEADGIALYMAHWTLAFSDEQDQHLTAIVVLRAHPETGWKVVIDNSRGPSVLYHPVDLQDIKHEPVRQ